MPCPHFRVIHEDLWTLCLPEPLTPVYPSDGVVTADYPLTQLASASGTSGDAFRRLTGYLLRPDIQRRISGSTAIYESLEKAYGVIGAKAAQDSGRITSIVLMSDGESNQGATADAFRAWYGKQSELLWRVPVFTILFGESATDQMNGHADLTHGKTFDARTQSLSAVFGEIRGYQ